MLDFLGKRLQKSLQKMKAKTTLTEADLVAVTREIKMALLEADVNLFVVKDFLKAVKQKALDANLVGTLNPSQQMIKIVHDELVTILGGKTATVSWKGTMPTIMLVGLQGSGKTTTAAKVAKYVIKKHNAKNPLLIAADIYRPAAIDQLITLGKQLQIAVYADQKTKVAPKIVTDGLAYAKAHDHDFVIIDTAGRLAIDETLMAELVAIKKVASPQEILFVADALSGQDIINVATAFNEQINLTGAIITKLDSDARGGAALSITKMLGVPIKFIGTGEKMAALDVFHPDRMADRILGMGDVMSLIEKASETLDQDKSQKLLGKMMRGQFDLNDLIEQFKQVKKLGKFSKVMKMMPGMDTNKVSSERVDAAERKWRLYEIIISSMTSQERKNPKLLKNATRKMRVIKGSGRSNQEFNALINDFERMAKQMKSVAKSLKDGSFNPGMMGGMTGGMF